MSVDIIDELIETDKDLEIRETEFGTFYYKNNQLHRINGPASISKTNNTECWYFEGLVHRIGGPAIKYVNGYEAWCQEGLMHREDGPAIIYADGGGKEWWIKGKFIRKEN